MYIASELVPRINSKRLMFCFMTTPSMVGESNGRQSPNPSATVQCCTGGKGEG